MRIDMDTHYWPRHMVDRVSHAAKGYMEFGDGVASYYRDELLVQTFREGRWDLSKRYEGMDLEGFDVQVLIPDNRPLVYDLDPDLGCEMARAYNDCTAEDMRGHQRFIGVSWVYLPEVEESIKEMRRAANELGLHAVKLMGGFDGTSLADRSLWPLYEEAQLLDIPILVHPVATLYRVPEARGSARRVLGLTVTFMTIITDLIFEGVLDKFPRLRFGFFEGGAGWVPFLMARIHNQVARGWDDDPSPRVLSGAGPAELERDVDSYFRQLYIAGVAWELDLPHVCDAWPDHNLLIGSDFNHADAVATWGYTIKQLDEMPGLSEWDKEKILGENAVRFLGQDTHPERIPQL